MADATATSPQKMEFQTEAKQLLNLMVNALYTHKEVFLRELISNASDALDKLRFEALTNSSIKTDESELAIHIKIDTNGKILTISDNGIGMDRETREKALSLFFSSKGAGGTGLGLFIANKIAQAHAGSIEIESEEGKGSRFTVALPASPPPSEPESAGEL